MEYVNHVGEEYWVGFAQFFSREEAEKFASVAQGDAKVMVVCAECKEVIG